MARSRWVGQLALAGAAAWEAGSIESSRAGNSRAPGLGFTLCRTAAGRHIISAGQFLLLPQVWDAENLTCLATLTGHQGPVRTLVRCGDKVFSGSYDKTVRWGIAGWRVLLLGGGCCCGETCSSGAASHDSPTLALVHLYHPHAGAGVGCEHAPLPSDAGGAQRRGARPSGHRLGCVFGQR